MIKFIKYTFSYKGRRDPVQDLPPIRKVDLIVSAFAGAGFILMLLLVVAKMLGYG